MFNGKMFLSGLVFTMLTVGFVSSFDASESKANAGNGVEGSRQVVSGRRITRRQQNSRRQSAGAKIASQAPKYSTSPKEKCDYISYTAPVCSPNSVEESQKKAVSPEDISFSIPVSPSRSVEESQKKAISPKDISFSISN